MEDRVHGVNNVEWDEISLTVTMNDNFRLRFEKTVGGYMVKKYRPCGGVIPIVAVFSTPPENRYELYDRLLKLDATTTVEEAFTGYPHSFHEFISSF